ncbi:MAG: hypothetical protein ACYC2X_08330 [Coriobacteriia bacterium]
MMTKDSPSRAARTKAFIAIVAGVALALAVLSLAGCAPEQDAEQAGAPTAEEPKGFGMGGVDQPVAILASALEDQPVPWDLGTPESAVRSYLDWVSYAYRITESEAASQTQSAYQLVRTDAYIQANLQEQRLLDQTLTSIKLGEPSIEGSTAVVPADEVWSYRYVSIVEAGETLSGPHTAHYKTTYTLVQTENGWVVDNITVEPVGDVE